MIKPGMFIADRYEIIDTVGSGGMADVYKARCHKLNRFVAVKVLKDEFSTDESFVEKFRAEAQSAAGLQHPNIVNIYDVGEENGVYYIVMELIEGITLKNFIERKGRLDVREATGIAIQIAQGLESAHSNDIIHRDIKPQNIIISRDGKVKVADFGIAKAASSNTLTSSAMGSVHYISPEQARGGYSDAKSDIYSLGITMYEMISGKVPFEGDNAVSIALLHIQEDIPPLGDMFPDIPISTNKIVLKCLQKKPERRYLSVVEMINDLKRSLVEPNVDFVVIPDVLNNSPTIALSPNDVNAIRNGAMQGSSNMNQGQPMQGDMMGGPQGQMMGGPNVPMGHGDGNFQNYGYHDENGYNDEFIDPDEEKVDDKLEKITKIGGIIIIALIIGIIIYFLATSGKNNDEPAVSEPPQTTAPMATVPSDMTIPVQGVVGKTEQKAIEMLEAQGFIVSVRHVAPPEGKEQEYNLIVKRQWPEEGTIHAKGSAVSIVVYKLGAEPDEELEVVKKKLPDFADKTPQEVIAALSELFKQQHQLTIKYEETYDDNIEEGKIVSTKPAAGQELANNGTLVLVLSKGKDEDVQVPSLIGLSKEDAINRLRSVGLELGNTREQVSSSHTEGTVIHQSHNANSRIPRGSKIDLTLAKKEETATPQPTTEAPLEEYTVSVTCKGDVEQMYTEMENGDPAITFRVSVRYKGSAYYGSTSVKKSVYQDFADQGVEVEVKVQSRTPVKKADINETDVSVLLEGDVKPGATAKIIGFDVVS